MSFFRRLFRKKESVAMAARVIPSTMRKWSVTKLVNNFKKGCELVSVPVPEVGPKQVLVRNRFVGMNASDNNNVPAGRYSPGVPPPFDIGFEGVGEVVKTGPGCKNIKVGQPIGHVVMGSFSEYQVVPEHLAFPLPEVKAEYVTLLASAIGVTTGLDKLGEIKKGETVFVTAAAGSAGQVAVQWAKAAGCHVIGTCSSEAKKTFLKSIGCDRPINYKEENVQQVLSSEYKKGIDVAFENVGGEMLVHAVNNIAQFGRIVLHGMISVYEKDDMSMDVFPNLVILILRNASIKGHLFTAFPDIIPQYVNRMVEMQKAGTLNLRIEDGSSTPGGLFTGLEDIPRALDHVYSQTSFGKLVVELKE